MAWYLTGDAAADELLSNDAFALLAGMILDQQVPMERAFSAPNDLRTRLGGRLDVTEVAALDHDSLVMAFSERPALHRFPVSMAERVQAAANIVVEEYGGDAGAIWNTAADGKELMKRLRALPGFGEQKAKIFIAMLAKRLGVKPDGWEQVAGPFGKAGSYVSVADIDSPEAMLRVRDYKKQMKAAAKSVAPAEPEAARRTREAVRDPRVESCSLYLCTPDRPDLEEFVGACIDGGVDIVQLREKNLEARPLLERAVMLRNLCRERRVPFILNDRPDLALTADTDGVHVGQDDIFPEVARRLVGDDRIVGLSTHRVGELENARGAPVDYVSAGPVVETPTKPGRRGTGLSYIVRARAVTDSWPGGPMPFFVTGGVTPETIPAIYRAGAERFVVVRYLTESPEPRAAASRLREAIDAQQRSAV